MNIEKRLKEFEESCLEMASEEASKLKAEIEQEIEEQIKKELDEYKIRKDWNYNKTVENLEKDYMKEVFNYQTECKKEILNTKKNIYVDLKNEIINKIKVFTECEGYKDYLYKSIKKSLEKIPKNTNTVIGLTNKDISRFKDDLIKEFNLNIKEIDEKYIGGCIIENETIFIDNTLENSIEENMID